LDQELISYSAHFVPVVVVVLVGVTSSKSIRLRRLYWDLGEIKRDCSTSKHALVLGVDFWYDVICSRWRPWRHFTQKSVAIW